MTSTTSAAPARRLPVWVELVGGHRLPRQLAGHPALELCNTLADCADPHAGSDYLTDFAALTTWAHREGLLDAELVRAADHAAELDPEAADRDLDRVRRFRVALWQTLVDPAPAAREVVSDEVEATARHLLLETTGEPRFTFSPDLGTRLPLLAASWSAAQLLTSSSRNTVRHCAGADCGWLFLDLSGRRRWCLMASCGNRAKARRFAQRQRRTT